MKSFQRLVQTMVPLLASGMLALSACKPAQAKSNPLVQKVVELVKREDKHKQEEKRDYYLLSFDSFYRTVRQEDRYIHGELRYPIDENTPVAPADPVARTGLEDRLLNYDIKVEFTKEGKLRIFKVEYGTFGKYADSSSRQGRFIDNHGDGIQRRQGDVVETNEKNCISSPNQKVNERCLNNLYQAHLARILGTYKGIKYWDPVP